MYRECGKGWNDIIDALEHSMLEIDPDYKVDQIKEKYGGLRYYFTPSDNKYNKQLDELVSIAELQCEVTCEICGKPGILRTGRWFSTRCEEHK